MAKHPIEENDDNISMSDKEIELLKQVALSHPYVDKLLNYYMLRDKDVGKQLYDAVVSRMDRLSITINSGKLGQDNNKEVDALIELMGKSTNIIKGMMALKEFSTLGIKREETKGTKSILEQAEDFNRNRKQPDATSA